MLQSTLPTIAFQGVFGLPGADFLFSPIAFFIRIYFHAELRQDAGAWKSGLQMSLSAILTWGAKVCGLGKEFKAAARWIDIASCGVILSDAMEALAAQISHIYAFTLYGSSLETPLQKQPSYDLKRLSQLSTRFFLALANFHLALSGERSEYLLFSNIDLLVRQFRFKREKFTAQIENLLPGQAVGPATDQLLNRVHNTVHVTVTDRIMNAAKSTLTHIGLRAPDTPEKDPEPMRDCICWTATPVICYD